MQLILVSGRSGSGKSISLHVLEDLGFYCIDNLPLKLIPKLLAETNPLHEKLAVSIDARNIVHSTAELGELLNEIQAKPDTHTDILYLDAQTDTLLRRFSETRRKHPLSNQTTPLQEALEAELELLKPIAEFATFRIDTSNLTMHQLRDLLYQNLRKQTPQQLSLLFQSFGFKHGVPSDTDYVFDVRCLPNPYWETRLRSKNGQDPDVKQYLLGHAITQELLADMRQFLETWIPRFAADNRNYMTIAVGCTGGQHRSVFCCEHLADYFTEASLAELDSQVQVRHRDMP